MSDDPRPTTTRVGRSRLAGPQATGEMRRWAPRLEAVARDVRHAVRTLRRDARLTTFAALIVGLGIGASVTVFSIVQALLLRPLPFPDPDRLAWISNGRSFDLSGRTVQVSHVWTIREASRTVVDVAGYSEFYGAGDHTLTGGDEPERVTGLQVTERFFPLLGVRPWVGRLFTVRESEENGPKTVLLGHRFWERRFASDRGIVGRAISIDGEPTTVVGVLPASFDFGSIFAPGRRVDYFVPFPLGARNNRKGNMLALVGRLRRGVRNEDAQRELTALVERAGYADGRNEFHPLVTGLRDHVSGAFRPAMLVLAGAVILVMLMVSANLSNLLLTRTAGREREMALRVALGANRWRLVRQLLTESLVLTCAGAALGVALATGGTHLLAQSGVLEVPLLDQVRVDGEALALAVGAAIVTGFLVGLMPALRVSTLVAPETLKEAGRGATSGRRQVRTRGALVVIEVAVACVLLVGSGLLARSLVRVLDTKLGFRPERAVAVRIDPRERFEPAARRNAYYHAALDRVRSAPGVESAGLTDVLPMGFNRQWSVTTRERNDRAEQEPRAFLRVVSDGYLRAMGIPVRSGRDFTDGDDATSRQVIIVNEPLARVLWPGQSPLGRMVTAGRNAVREVVGVVPGLRHRAVEVEPGSEMYIPVWQTGDYAALHVVARGALPAGTMVAAVRSALRAMDPDLPLTETRTIQEIVDRSVSPRRFIVIMLGGFAAFALVLASLGIYAVISYGVAQRTQEIGIRMALGATTGRLRRGILGQTLELAIVGLAIGLAGAWALARAMQGLLFGVTWTDPVTFIGAVAVLVAVTVLAGYLPARRASRVDPVEALRAE